jgi:excisionase family DNA binding protein
MDNLLNVNQAAFILKVHPLTIRRYIKDGKLKAIKAGGNVRIRESELLQFNKDFVPRAPEEKSPFRTKIRPAKSFTKDDPFLRIKGRGASLHLTTQ